MLRFAVPISVLVIAVFTVPAAADERKVFYGTWGTAQQCARAPIKEGGTVLAEPFQINAGGLRQGLFWCRLRWFPVQRRDGGFFTGATAQCGEDGVRDYLMRMRLSEDQLTLHWSFQQSSGPLGRCPQS